ncbi:MAG: hypothetical protein V7752_21965 [Halopseudomonas sp.]
MAVSLANERLASSYKAERPGTQKYDPFGIMMQGSIHPIDKPINNVSIHAFWKFPYIHLKAHIQNTFFHSFKLRDRPAHISTPILLIEDMHCEAIKI